jgi:hypothetical protein
LARQFQPETVVKDYEDTYEFLVSLADCLKPNVVKSFWQVIEDPKPGYEPVRRIVGCLFSRDESVFHMQGMKYDDELQVSWTKP